MRWQALGVGGLRQWEGKSETAFVDELKNKLHCHFHICVLRPVLCHSWVLESSRAVVREEGRAEVCMYMGPGLSGEEVATLDECLEWRSKRICHSTWALNKLPRRTRRHWGYGNAGHAIFSNGKRSRRRREENEKHWGNSDNNDGENNCNNGKQGFARHARHLKAKRQRGRRCCYSGRGGGVCALHAEFTVACTQSRAAGQAKTAKWEAVRIVVVQ